LITSPGKWQIELERPGLPICVRTLVVGAQAPEATLTWWPPLSVEVRAYDGDARIGAPELKLEWIPTATAVGHEGRISELVATTGRVNRLDLLVTEPGRYRITLSPDARYAPHPPLEVEVKAGEPAPIAVLHLERAR
jgi:hypothetical protein